MPRGRPKLPDGQKKKFYGYWLHQYTHKAFLEVCDEPGSVVVEALLREYIAKKNQEAVR
jgi:hypothetical protein